MVKEFHHQESNLVPYHDKLLYDIVKDVSSYPAFLPWCLSARIVDRGAGFFVADLLVGLPSVKEQFRSQVFFDDDKKTISTKGVGDGPLSSMDSEWQFIKQNQGETQVSFQVRFCFSSRVTEKLFAPFFTKLVEKMSAAFLARAQQSTP